MTGCPAKEWQLLKWAGEIGSDISMFFSEGAAFCTGKYCPPSACLLVSKSTSLVIWPSQSIPVVMGVYVMFLYAQASDLVEPRGLWTLPHPDAIIVAAQQTAASSLSENKDLTAASKVGRLCD